MEFEGEIATIQRRLADTSDLIQGRLAVLDALAVRPGESVLEAGCGGGVLLPSLATAVGTTGRVVGIDISDDQIAAAHHLCAGMDVVETDLQDVCALPYEDASFDAAVAVEVIEFPADPARGLSELQRVLRPHGRLVLLDTNWDTVFWNTDAPELTAQMQEAWRHHAPHQNLPAEMRPLLADAGFQMVRQAPVTVINNAYHEDSFSYWLAQLMVAFAVGRGLVSQMDADAWLKALQEAEGRGRFFFSSTPVLTMALAL